MTGTVTAPTTARQSSIFSASERTGHSPVVPAMTRPSFPSSTSWRASVTAPSTSRRPSASNGVTIAVSTEPKRSVRGVISMTARYQRSAARLPPIWRRCRSELAAGSPVAGAASPAPRSVRPSGDLRLRSAHRLAFGELEGGELLVGVRPVLERDHTELGELLPQPPVAGVEQAELLAVRHDLREEHRLEGGPVRRLHDERQHVMRRELEAVPDLLLQEAVAHAHRRLEG